MAVRCRDLLQLGSLRKLKLVAGESGLDRVVRWVHVAEILPDTRSIFEWLHGGELLFVIGGGMKDDNSLLDELIQKAYDKKLSAMIVYVGLYIREIPDSARKKADSLGFPLFELPWEVKLVEVTEEVCSNIVLQQMHENSEQSLVENLLYSEPAEPSDLYHRAAYHGFDLNHPWRIMITDIDDFSGYIKEKGLKDEKRISELKQEFYQQALNVFFMNNSKILSMKRNDSLITILELGDSEEKDVRRLADSIRDTVCSQMGGLSVSVGISNAYSSVFHMKKGFSQSEQALKIAKHLKLRNNTIFYRQMGIFRLLNKVGDAEELRDFYTEQLGRLEEFDRLNGAKLVETLGTYIFENANMVKASRTLYLHRNTLKYRLQKIEEITGFNLQDAETRFLLMFALKIGQYLASQ